MTLEKLFVPFPFFFNDDPNNGLLIEMPNFCLKCTSKSCLSKTESADIKLCSYGFNYFRVGKIVVSGILISNIGNSSKQYNKRLKEYDNHVLKKHMVDNFIKNYEYYEQHFENELSKKRETIIDNYIKTEKYKEDFLEIIKPEISRGLTYVHDFKQIIGNIRQHINIIIEERYAGDNFEEKLSSANNSELAIYKGSALLLEKLNITKFLLTTEWIYDKQEFRKFRFHGIVIKYLRLYSGQADKKNLKINVHKKSYLEILANPDALSVIPHTLIDNAIKYAPQNSIIDITVEDKTNAIFFEVVSNGPRIKKSEKNKIFDPFYRGSSAKILKEEGTGYGLYVSQMIAIKHLETEITYQQNSMSGKYSNFFITKFQINIPLVCVGGETI